MEKRPAGISIIAFIYTLVSCVGLISSFSLSSENWFATATMLVLGLSAVAFYLGNKWAWWIIGTMTLFSIIVNVPQLYFVITNSELIPDINKYYLKHGGKLIIQTLILFFLFSKPVIKFFSFEKPNKIKLLVFLVAAAGLLFFGLKLLSYIMLATHR